MSCSENGALLVMENVSEHAEGFFEVTTNGLSNWTWNGGDIDTSEHFFPNDLWHRKSTSEVAIKTCVMVLIGIIGIFLNSIIVVIIAKNRYLWTVNNMLVGNLALMDLLTLILCPWFMLVRDFFQNFVLKNFGCRFEGFMQASFMLATLFAVMLVSYDRLAAAVLTADAKITKAAAPKFVIGSWVVSLLLSLPWITSREYVERIWLDHIEMYCAEDLNVLIVYWHFIVSMVVWLPLTVLFVTYAAILFRLECGFRQLSARGNGQSISKIRGKAMRISACVLFTAVACRLPYSVFLFWMKETNFQMNSIDGGYETMIFVANMLMYFNSAVNPLIYGFTNMRLKKAMDKTPGVACFRFGSWCCLCPTFERKLINQPATKNTEKIFVIESSPKPNNKLTKMFKNVIHSNKGSMELSFPKVDENTNRPTRVTPLKS